MPRPLRIEFAGARHHVTNRGARKEPVFRDDWSRRRFLSLLSLLPERYNVLVHGYALMTNHYHLVVESVDGKLPRAIQFLDGKFARSMNVRHAWDGPIWKGRYFNSVVESAKYWRHLLSYVHLNPYKAGLRLEMMEPLWTSHTAYVDVADRPGWLTTRDLLESFGGVANYRKYLDDDAEGRVLEPEGFQTVLRRLAPETGRFNQRIGQSTVQLIEDALEQVAMVTGVAMEVLARPRDGAANNDARCLGAWWLATTTDAPVSRVAACLGCTGPTISKRIRLLESRQSKAHIAEWVVALRAIRN